MDNNVWDSPLSPLFNVGDDNWFIELNNIEEGGEGGFYSLTMLFS